MIVPHLGDKKTDIWPVSWLAHSLVLNADPCALINRPLSQQTPELNQLLRRKVLFWLRSSLQFITTVPKGM